MRRAYSVAAREYDPRRVMPTLHHPSPRGAAALAIVALAAAAAIVVQQSGPNQAAHFALVRALASGTAEIDPGETIDASFVDGRYFAAKAPGLALLTLPWYGTLRAVGLQHGSLAVADEYRERVWELNLFGSVLPFLALLVLMSLTAGRVVPGYGPPAAVLLGAGTLLLPFATLFFDHLLSAALGFAAFTVLFHAREHGRAGWRLPVGGLLAGLAIVVEFPLGIVAVVLAAYAAAGERRLRRVVAYAAGVVVGVLPLLAYNAWAFGSPLTLGYTNALEAPAGSGTAPVVGANEEGLYGVGLPDPRAALSLLVSEKGLLVVTPLAIAALFGLPALWRVGRRAEALVCGAVPLLFLAYNAGYYLPYGGQGPGPRFLVPALPFLALPLAVVLRARPLVVAGLGLVSAGVMALATITGPLTGVEYSLGTWLGRLGRGETVETLAGRAGIEPGWVAALPFGVALTFACLLALRGVPVVREWRRELPLLATLLAGWLVLVLAAPDLVPADAEHGSLAGALAVTLLLGLWGAAFAVARRWGARALLPLAPTLVLAAPAFDTRPRVALLVVVVFVAAGALWWGKLARSGRASAYAYASASGVSSSHG